MDGMSYVPVHMFDPVSYPTRSAPLHFVDAEGSCSSLKLAYQCAWWTIYDPPISCSVIESRDCGDNDCICTLIFPKQVTYTTPFSVGAIVNYTTLFLLGLTSGTTTRPRG
jgi:hypothetical protein